MNDRQIGAVVLAAGKSERMGEPKMGLPWGATTVIGQVIAVLVGSGLDDVVVVTGGGPERLVPLAPYVEVDLAAGRVVVDPPEGLLEP